MTLFTTCGIGVMGGDLPHEFLDGEPSEKAESTSVSLAMFSLVILPSTMTR